MAAKKNGKLTRALPMLKESAQDIWLAGLGAFAMAGEEGSKLFRQLVKRGQGMEKVNKTRIHQITARAESLRGDARAVVGRLTSPLEDGMTNAMHKLGVPTRREIQTLTHKVEELTRVVAKSKTRTRAKGRRAAV